MKIACCLTLWTVLAFTSLLCGQEVNADTTPEASKTRDAVAPAADLQQLYKQVLPSVCWVKCERTKTGDTSFGTGWVLDARQNIIVTNEHVVEGGEFVTVSFPAEENGRLQVEPSFYDDRYHRVSGQVVRIDKERDLAIIQLEKLPKTAKPLTLRTENIDSGERVFTIASYAEGSEGLWVLTVGHVRLTYRRSTATGGICQVVETDMAFNRGNSGGAVFDLQGRVIGVVEGYETQARLVSMTIAASEVESFAKDSQRMIAPRTSKDFHARGAEHHEEDRLSLAQSDYDAALAIDPNYSPAIADRGWLLFNRGDFLTAKASFERALRIDRDNANAYSGLGCVLCELKQYPQSVTMLTEAISRDPYDGRFYRNRAVTCDWMGDVPGSVRDMERAVELQPENASFQRFYGDVLRKAKRPSEAMKAFAVALGLNGDDAATWTKYGAACWEAGYYDAGAQALSKSLKIDPTQHGAYNTRGNCLYALKLYDKASYDYIQAFELDRTNGIYVFNFGEAMLKLAKYSEALEAYSLAIKLRPDDAEIYVKRALVYEKLGNRQAAVADVHRANALRSASK